MYMYSNGKEIVAEGPFGISRNDLYKKLRSEGKTHDFAEYLTLKLRSSRLDVCRLCKGTDQGCPMCRGYGEVFTKTETIYNDARRRLVV